MKFILFASIISFAVAAAIGSADNVDEDLDVNNNNINNDNIYRNNINYSPYKDTLSKGDCNDIVNAFASVLQNKRYKNRAPKDTYKKYLARNFVERSGSINTLISPNNNVNANVLTNRDDWFNGAQQNPVKSIKASRIYVADGNKCLWQWNFDKVGSSRYNVHGVNLLYINDDKVIAGTDIEFNSMAWGVNTKQVNQYCPA